MRLRTYKEKKQDKRGGIRLQIWGVGQEMLPKIEKVCVELKGKERFVLKYWVNISCR